VHAAAAAGASEAFRCHLSDSDVFRHPEPQRVTAPTLSPFATPPAARGESALRPLTLRPRLADTRARRWKLGTSVARGGPTGVRVSVPKVGTERSRQLNWEGVPPDEPVARFTKLGDPK